MSNIDLSVGNKLELDLVSSINQMIMTANDVMRSANVDQATFNEKNLKTVIESQHQMMLLKAEKEMLHSKLQQQKDLFCGVINEKDQELEIINQENVGLKQEMQNLKDVLVRLAGKINKEEVVDYEEVDSQENDRSIGHIIENLEIKIDELLIERQELLHDNGQEVETKKKTRKHYLMRPSPEKTTSTRKVKQALGCWKNISVLGQNLVCSLNQQKLKDEQLKQINDESNKLQQRLMIAVAENKKFVDCNDELRKKVKFLQMELINAYRQQAMLESKIEEKMDNLRKKSESHNYLQNLLKKATIELNENDHIIDGLSRTIDKLNEELKDYRRKKPGRFVRLFRCRS